AVHWRMIFRRAWRCFFITSIISQFLELRRFGRQSTLRLDGKPSRSRADGPNRIFPVVPDDIPDSRRTHPCTVHCSGSDPCNRRPLRPRLRGAPSPDVQSTSNGKSPKPPEEFRVADLCYLPILVSTRQCLTAAASHTCPLGADVARRQKRTLSHDRRQASTTTHSR